jgi:hypothetical protein
MSRCGLESSTALSVVRGNAIKKFKLISKDFQAIEIATKTARRFLKYSQIRPQQIVALGNALYALERLPLVTPGSFSSFGVVHHAGTQKFSEMRYIDFKMSESTFEISKGGSIYDKAVGRDSFSEPGWLVEVGAYRKTECELYSLENTVDEYWNLGGQISTSDESEIDYD